MGKIALVLSTVLFTSVLFAETDKQTEYERLLMCSKASSFSSITVEPGDESVKDDYGSVRVFTSKGEIRIPLTLNEALNGKATLLVNNPDFKEPRLITLEWDSDSKTPMVGLKTDSEKATKASKGRDVTALKPGVSESGNDRYAVALANHFTDAVHALSTYYEFDSTAAKFDSGEFQKASSNEDVRKTLNTKIKNAFSASIPSVLEQNSIRLEQFVDILKKCKGSEADTTLHVFALKEAVAQLSKIRRTQKMNTDVSESVKRKVAQKIEVDYLDGLAAKKYQKPEVVLSGVTGYVAQVIQNERAAWKPGTGSAQGTDSGPSKPQGTHR